jgi:hypothetical protein
VTACCPEFASTGYSHTEVCPAFDSAAADPAVWVAACRAATVSPIESPTDVPAKPAAANVAGGTGVSAEAVEALLAFWSYWHHECGHFDVPGEGHGLVTGIDAKDSLALDRLGTAVEAALGEADRG